MSKTITPSSPLLGGQSLASGAQPLGAGQLHSEPLSRPGWNRHAESLTH